MTFRLRFTTYLLLAAVSLGVYFLVSAAYFESGFPLDDAWIHQTYARNLAQGDGWVFQQGNTSGGSTAPLWTLIVAIGYLLRLPPLWWVYMLGVVTLAALAETVHAGLVYLLPDKPRLAVLGGALVLFEWHLVWAAGSGMETLLYALVAAAVLVALLRDWGRPFGIGLLIGLSVWIRPDGLTLLGPVLFVCWLQEKTLRQKVRETWQVGLGVLLLIGPYFAFNAWLAGDLLPSTYFAKQAEYAELRALPLWKRWADQLAIPMVGAGLVAAPGLLLVTWNALRKKQWVQIAVLCWVFGFALVYALRLPVTYQHGRYLLPVIPMWLMLGYGGAARVLKLNANRMLPRVLGRSWLLLFPVTTLAFYFVGVNAFARDVSVIQSEMVAAARWLALHAEDGDLVAAHDIGAIGYFSESSILDMAGLVSPEVIPIVRNQPALKTYLDQAGARYFVTLEGWYPELEKGLLVEYRTDAAFSPAQGGTNMVIYAWSIP